MGKHLTVSISKARSDCYYHLSGLGQQGRSFNFLFICTRISLKEYSVAI
jgi:hypothetical protein